ncbi:MAG: SCO family protein [Clostridia bacterium]
MKWRRIGVQLLAWLAGAAFLAGCGTSGTGAAAGSASGRSQNAVASAATAINLLTGRTNRHNIPAPDFTLTNQFGQSVSLQSFRGRVVLLDFVDSQCTTICPLTTMSMVDAVNKLGSAANRVALVAVNANPTATTVQDVYTYSLEHGVLHRWQYLTGSLQELKAVWAAYHVEVSIVHGGIDHTPALYLINAQGQERYLYLTNGLYGVVGTESQVLAHDLAATLGLKNVPPLPAGVPAVETAHDTFRLPALMPGGSGVTLSPGETRVLVFYGSWLPNFQQQLAGLNTYQSWARAHGAPPLVAIDEMETEPSAVTARLRLQGVHLAYPVVEDRSGAVADAYNAHDMAWIVVVVHGKVVAIHDGFVSGPNLIHEVQSKINAAHA